MQKRIAPRGFHAAIATKVRGRLGGTIGVSPDFKRFRFYAGKYSAEIVIAIPDELVPTSITPDEIDAAAAWLMERVAPALHSLIQ